MTAVQENRVEEAVAIMRANDRGGYTVPTARLYPYQWNWDSAFAALGFAMFDRDRAWRELELLFEGQWPDGMVPHIIFRKNDPDYFPGPEIWGSGQTPPTSGHSQPPVATSIILYLVENGDEEDLAQASRLFDKMLAWHRWYHSARDPDGTGLVAIIHPWESGRDNCPDWDIGMNRMTVSQTLGTHHRRDTGHVDAAQRPTDEQYNRYLTIVEFGRNCGWDHEHIYRNGPFLMADPCVHFALVRADRDLKKLAQLTGNNDAITEIEGWISRHAHGNSLLWNPEAHAYCAQDVRSGEFSEGITNASMLAFYAGAGGEAENRALLGHFDAIMNACKAGFPSWDPRHDAYESQRYWRGPVWAMMNWMIAQGLREMGETGRADRLHLQTIETIEQAGFYEYFDSRTGEGCGGRDFTWTAAIYLVWKNGTQSASARSREDRALQGA